MARGISLCFGVRLSPNFNFPFFADSPSDFWRKWHISLSKWIRTYVYMPLLTRWREPVLTITVTFLVMGFWHGLSWHYAEWGLYWSFVIVFHQLIITRVLAPRWPIVTNRIFAMTATFSCAVIGLTFFRAQNLVEYIHLLQQMFVPPKLAQLKDFEWKTVLACISVFLIYEGYLFTNNDELKLIKSKPIFQLTFYAILGAIFQVVGKTDPLEFMYFHF